MDVLHQLELVWILWLQSLGSWLAEPLRLVTMLGQEEFYLLAMPALYWCLDAAFGLRVAVMLIFCNQFSSLFKLVFHSPRPYWISSTVKGLVSEGTFGLPSGHALNAAGIWGTMAASTRERWAKIALVVIIFLIGFSRIVLGVHFISDVIAGWLIGGLLLWLFLSIEKPISTWLRKRSLVEMLGLAAASALLLILMVVLPAAALSGFHIPAEWAQNALSSQPSSPIDPFNMESAFTIAGTWLGMMAGAAWLFHRQGGFHAEGAPTQRLLRYLVGMVGIFILYFGLGKVFPRNADAISYALRFLRYTLIGLWVSALAPLLFERLGLVRIGKKQVASLSSTENLL